MKKSTLILGAGVLLNSIAIAYNEYCDIKNNRSIKHWIDSFAKLHAATTIDIKHILDEVGLESVNSKVKFDDLLNALAEKRSIAEIFGEDSTGNVHYLMHRDDDIADDIRELQTHLDDTEHELCEEIHDIVEKSSANFNTVQSKLIDLASVQGSVEANLDAIEGLLNELMDRERKKEKERESMAADAPYVDRFEDTGYPEEKREEYEAWAKKTCKRHHCNYGKPSEDDLEDFDIKTISQDKLELFNTWKKCLTTKYGHSYLRDNFSSENEMYHAFQRGIKYGFRTDGKSGSRK